jgi:hypothetical protein
MEILATARVAAAGIPIGAALSLGFGKGSGRSVGGKCQYSDDGRFKELHGRGVERLKYRRTSLMCRASAMSRLGFILSPKPST